MTKVISAAEAKAKLSSLLDRAARGEEITITRHGKPVARIVPAAELPPRKPGRWKGLVQFDDDALLEPMSEEDLAAWDGTLTDAVGVLKGRKRG